MFEFEGKKSKSEKRELFMHQKSKVWDEMMKMIKKNLKTMKIYKIKNLKFQIKSQNW